MTACGEPPYMVNAARADPRTFATQAPKGSVNASSYVCASGTPCVFFTAGAISSVYLDSEGRGMGSSPNFIRGINIAALAVEWPRTACFFGNVFRKSEGMSLIYVLNMYLLFVQF